MSVPARIAAGGSLAGVLVLYAAGVVLVAGTLAVPFHGLLPAGGAESLGLNRIVYRLAELLALLGLVPLLGLTGGTGAVAWGYGRAVSAEWLREVAAGFLAGLASLGLFAVLLLVTAVRVPRPDLEIGAGWLAGVVVAATFSALLIALIEETWFRGGLQSLCARFAGPFAAIAVCSAIYAALHFVRPPELPPGAAPAPLDGLRLLGLALDRFSDPEIAGAALSLLAVGVLLGLVRLRTGRIAACIGLHAGWVVVIKVLKELTHLSADPALVRLVEGYDGVLGWLSVVWFWALAIGYGWWVVARREREG